MRELTINRRKTFVGSLMKVKIYIHDPNSNEINIKGYPCRKLGEIKNNSSLTISIDEERHILFAIFDVVSKDYCYDAIEIPEGISNIMISGKNKFSPLQGNPFIFDK